MIEKYGLSVNTLTNCRRVARYITLASGDILQISVVASVIGEKSSREELGDAKVILYIHY